MKTKGGRIAFLLYLTMLGACVKSAPGPSVALTPLQKVAKAIDALSVAIGVAEDAVATASTQGLISNADGVVVMTACQKIATSAQLAVVIVQSATTLDSATVSKLLGVIGPAAASLVPNPNINKDVQIAVLGAQTALTTLQLIISGVS